MDLVFSLRINGTLGVFVRCELRSRLSGKNRVCNICLAFNSLLLIQQVQDFVDQ